jgi:hypothetical protein
MRVSLAVQILSHSVAAGIETCVARGDLPNNALQTAAFCKKGNNIWDVMNFNSTNADRFKETININNLDARLHDLKTYREGVAC